MKNFFLLSLFLCLCSPLYAQNKIFLSYNPGISLYNSENSGKTIGDKHLGWFPGFSIAYESENIWGLNLLLEYNWTQKRIYDVQTFAMTTSTGSGTLGYFNADLILACHNLDISVSYKVKDWLYFAAGPTVSLVDRSIVMDNLPNYIQEKVGSSFDDRLISLCLGVNGSVNIEIPFQTSSQYVFFFSSIKLRYLQSVWFDDRGRNLDNYSQSFIFTQLNIGLGYNF
jgi:hypothetical protein